LFIFAAYSGRIRPLMRFQFRMTSSLIGGVGDDAAHLAERIEHFDLQAATPD